MELDSLSYDYIGNQLDVVNDLVEATDISNDFEDNDSFLSQGEYGNDNNGNMFWDENKSIDNISYNHLNLPEIIDIIGKGRISYLYDVAGNKLRMDVFDEKDDLTKRVSYEGNFVYNMQNISSFGRQGFGNLVNVIAEHKINGKSTVFSVVFAVVNKYTMDVLPNNPRNAPDIEFTDTNGKTYWIRKRTKATLISLPYSKLGAPGMELYWGRTKEIGDLDVYKYLKNE